MHVKKVLFVFTTWLILGYSQKLYDDNDALDLVLKGFSEYTESGIKPDYLDNALSTFQFPHAFRDGQLENLKGNASIVCALCNGLADFIISQRRNGMTNLQLTAEATTICLQLRVETARVCEGTISSNIEVLSRIIDRNPDLKGERICAILLQQLNCHKEGALEWTIELPEGHTVQKRKSEKSGSFRVLQITDLHYDPLYTPGKSNTCGEPLCCQIDQEDGDANSGTECGYWSDYRDADIPMHTFEELLRKAKSLDVDYVYFTGDIISHRVWSTSVANNTRDIKVVYETLRSSFDVPIIPTLGNHEPHPLDVWAANETDDSFSTQWLFQLFSEEYANLFDKDLHLNNQSLLNGGYYTVSPRDGFRIVVLNNNVGYTVNWWLIDNDYDPYGQLVWLVDVLTEAEQAGESVHILAHIPTGSGEFLKVWSREYNKIVERFSNTITAQFNGHTHRDEFSVYYSKSNSSKAINTAWNGGSVTPYDHGNPNFKIYEIDDTSYEVLDFESWTFNLTLANLNGNKTPEWYKLYSFRDAYKLSSLQPEDVSDLVYRMARDHSLLINYHIFRYKNGDYAVANGCDETCQKRYLCDISTTVFGETTQCEELQKIYDENV